MIKDKLFYVLNSIKRVSIKFYTDSCLVRASGLAYSTLLAMVPFITIVYAFGGFDSLGKTIESALLKTILPTHHEAFSQAIDGFTKNSLTTGAFGMIFFLFTSIFLINTVARNFDYIWGVNIKTNIFSRYATYTAILVFGSLLLGASTSVSEIVDSYIRSMGFREVEEYKKTFSFLIPYFLSLFIFFIMLIIIPSVKVRLKSALIGAIISSLLFELIKFLFGLWVVNSVRTSLIYGSLSIIPIFLVGLYLFWIIVLIGAEISYYLQHEKDPITGNPEELNMEEKILIGIEIFKQITSFYINNGGGLSYKELEKEISYSAYVIRYFVSIFTDNKLLLTVDGKHNSFIPGRSPDSIYIEDIVKVIYGGESRIILNSELSKKNSLAFSAGGFDSLEKKSLLELLKR